MRRENKAMRLASALLVLTLLATSMIAGTFAKYTAEGTGSATARVAKFGVDVTVDTANLFGKMYKDADNNNVVTSADDGSVTVSAAENVVAPGTTGSMTFSVSGTPEVAVNLAVEVSNPKIADSNDQLERVMLKAETYKYAAGSNKAEVKVDADYYPVKWTLKDKDDAVVTDKGSNAQETTDDVKLENVDLATINKYFESSTGGFQQSYPAGTDLSGIDTYTLSWEWAYDDATGTNNAKDTLLGDIAVDANKIKKGDNSLDLVENTDYCLTEAFNFKITVTQAD